MASDLDTKHYLAGTLAPSIVALHGSLGAYKTNGLFRDLFSLIEDGYPSERNTRLNGVIDTYKILKRRRSSPGWTSTHRGPYSFCRRPGPAVTRLNVHSAMTMTAARATIHGNTYQTSSPM